MHYVKRNDDEELIRTIGPGDRLKISWALPARIAFDVICQFFIRAGFYDDKAIKPS
jgi:hypothetical protein